MDKEEDKSKKKKKAKVKDAKKVIKFPSGGMMQAHGSSPQEQGVDSAHEVMKKFLEKTED